ncbi:hypothetical protein [Methylacidiphilum caldifontis]|uniref:Uncharacterized protein n=1 Tax=Methylacidiphilum caldifontis TaxID=2795386 RepID=A0A4Y8P9J6_9BACT|nr:hypothetical protein [Methylacidiphilum caldifontis]TFE67119.1 hypothetical protein A7Q10_09875 [Methylacidiphilum caldifontis]
MASDLSCDDAKNLLKILHEENWIPWIPAEQFVELSQHQDKAKLNQLEIFKELPRIGFPKSPIDLHQDRKYGMVIDVQLAEILELCNNPSLNFEEVVEKVKRIARGGYGSGKDSLEDFLKAFPSKEEFFAKFSQFHHVYNNEIVNLIYQLCKLISKLSGEVKLNELNEEDVRTKYEAFIDERLCRLYSNPQRNIIMNIIMGQYWPIMWRIISSGLGINSIIDECLFNGWLDGHEKLLQVSPGTLSEKLHGRKNEIPSWVITKALYNRMANSGKSPKGGDLVDIKFASMGLYLDAVELDKRTYEFLRQVSKEDKRIERAFNHCFKKENLRTTIDKLLEIGDR